MRCVAQVGGAGAVQSVNVVRSRALHTIFVVAVVGDVAAAADDPGNSIN